MTGSPDEILTALLRATVLLAVSALLLRGLIWWLRPSSPSVQRAGWFLVLVQGVVLFHLPVKVAWFEAPARELPAAVAEPGDGVAYEGPSAVALGPSGPAVIPPVADAPAAQPSPAIAPSETTEGFDWTSLGLAIWLGGVVFLPVLAALAYVRFLWRVSSARPAPESWLREWRSLLAAERIGRPGDGPSFRAAGDCPSFRAAKTGLSPSETPGTVIPLRVTDDVGPVMCWTPRGYRLFVPEGIWRELSASQRAAVLRHELAHLRRGDLWKTLLARLLALPHWFNPFAWWAVHKFAECAEWACDQAAAGRRRADATDYAKALLRLGAANRRLPSWATAVRGGSLFIRIRRVISARLSEDSLMKKATIVLAAVALVALNVVRVELVAKEAARGEAPEAGAAITASTAGTDLYGDPLPDGALIRLGTIRLRHPHRLTAVAFSPDGKLLASAGADGVIRFWSPQTGVAIRRLTGTKNPQDLAVAFSPDGTKLASAGEAGLVRLWDVASRKQLFSMQKHQGGVDSAAFSPDGQTFATGGEDGSVRIWDASSGRELLTLHARDRSPYPHVIAFSPDGKILASGGQRTIRLWDLDTLRTIRLWGAGNDTKPRVIEDVHGRELACLVFTPGGKAIISSGQSRVEWANNAAGETVAHLYGEIRMWDVSTGRLLREFRAEDRDLGSCSIALSSDGKVLASVCYDKIRIWDVPTGKPIRTIRHYTQSGGGSQDVAISPDGTVLAVRGGRCVVLLYDVSTGERLLQFPEAHEEWGLCVAWSPAGRVVATGSNDGSVRLWDPGSGRQLSRLRFGEGHAAGQRGLAFSPDGALIVAGGYDLGSRTDRDGLVKLWNVKNGREVLKKRADGRVTSIAFSPDGRRLAVATGWGLSYPSLGRRKAPIPTISICEVPTGKELLKLQGHQRRVRWLAFSADGKSLVSADETTMICRWNLADGKQLATIDVKGLEPSSLDSVAFSPDGKTLVTCGSAPDEPLIVRDLATGNEVGRIGVHEHMGLILAFSPDGQLLASACSGLYLSSKKYDESIYVWDSRTGNQLLRLTPNSVGVTALAFSPDGNKLISGMTNGTALIWDVMAAHGKLGR